MGKTGYVGVKHLGDMFWQKPEYLYPNASPWVVNKGDMIEEKPAYLYPNASPWFINKWDLIEEKNNIDTDGKIVNNSWVIYKG